MVASLFLRDYKTLSSKGVVFTPEDVVRLNSLAVKVKYSQSSASDLDLPRLVFMPRTSRFRRPLVLREPTIAHELWLERAIRLINPSSAHVFDFIYGFALSRPASRLPSPERPLKLLSKVAQFAVKHLCAFTSEQLSTAIHYVVLGPDPLALESAPKADPADEKRAEKHSFVIGLLADARALRLPISLDDAMRLTPSELQEAINRATAESGKVNWDAVRSRALADYVRAREEIVQRSKTVPKGDDPADVKEKQ